MTTETPIDLPAQPEPTDAQIADDAIRLALEMGRLAADMTQRYLASHREAMGFYSRAVAAERGGQYAVSGAPCGDDLYAAAAFLVQHLDRRRTIEPPPSGIDCRRVQIMHEVLRRIASPDDDRAANAFKVLRNVLTADTATAEAA